MTTPQTPQQRAEAQARVWLEPYYSPYLMAQSLAQLLLATEAACLEEVAKIAQSTADNLYCQCLSYCHSHCLGLQVIEKFAPEQQQEKLMEVRHSEQLMGGHIHLSRMAAMLREQAAQRRAG